MVEESSVLQNCTTAKLPDFPDFISSLSSLPDFPGGFLPERGMLRTVVIVFLAFFPYVAFPDFRSFSLVFLFFFQAKEDNQENILRYRADIIE